MSNKSLVGSDEASEMLGVHRATFLRWVADGVIEPVHQLPGANGAYLFERAAVQRLAADKAKASA
jgi:excisionase family DNA binding protein